jgi:dipeptidyl aminopeptidase/acylaminoacyl peptidase
VELVAADRGSSGWTERVVVGPSATSIGTFSNDGSRIAFLRSRPGMFEGDLFVINVDGSGERQVSDRLVNVSSPCWSPDDRTVAALTGPVPDWWKVSMFGWPDQVYVRFPVDRGGLVEIPAGTVAGIEACSWQRLAP